MVLKDKKDIENQVINEILDKTIPFGIVIKYNKFNIFKLL